MSSSRRIALVGLLMVACASTNVSRREEELQEVSWEEGCQDETTLELVCAEDTCAFFRCRDLTEESKASPGEIELARWPGLRPPGGGRRGGRGPRLGAEPVFLIRWYNHPAPSRSSPRVLSPDRFVKHHIFPQAPDLAAWFQLQGINIHQYTLLIPSRVHLRIHSGGQRGGMWNEEWRLFTRSRVNATPEQIWEHATKLIMKYDLAGASMVPY